MRRRRPDVQIWLDSTHPSVANHGRSEATLRCTVARDTRTDAGKRQYQRVQGRDADVVARLACLYEARSTVARAQDAELAAGQSFHGLESSQTHAICPTVRSAFGFWRSGGCCRAYSGCGERESSRRGALIDLEHHRISVRPARIESRRCLNEIAQHGDLTQCHSRRCGRARRAQRHSRGRQAQLAQLRWTASTMRMLRC